MAWPIPVAGLDGSGIEFRWRRDFSVTPQMTIWRRVARWIIKATLAQVHCRTRARAHTHTHTHTHKTEFPPPPTAI